MTREDEVHGPTDPKFIKDLEKFEADFSVLHKSCPICTESFKLKEILV